MGGRGAKYTTASAIIGQYEISSITASKTSIVDFFRSVDKNDGIQWDGEKIKVKRETMEKADRLAEKLANRMEIIDEDARQDYENIRSELKGTYTISAKDRSNISDFGEYARSKENVVNIGKNGTSIDQKYQELSSRYPQYFDASRVTNPADQLQDINRVVGELKDYKIKLPASERAEAKKDIRNALIRGYIASGMGRKAS